MRRAHAILVTIVLLASSVVGPASAQTNARPKNPYRGSPLMWDVNQVLDFYVDSVSRYYNLDESQKEYTRKLTTHRFKRFMGTYEQDVRHMMAEMVEFQINRQMPPAEMAKEWAARSQPIMNAVRGEIMEGTMTWREILNDEQKKIHDRDLQQLENYFNTWDDRLTRWSKGDVRETDFNMLGGKNPRTPLGRPVMLQRPEDAWALYVRNFKRIYELNSEQKGTADSILREVKQEAQRYRDGHKKQFDDLQKAFDELSADKSKKSKDQLEAVRQKVVKLREDQERLERPIGEDMFHKLKRDLERIPTMEQRKARQAHLEGLKSIADTRRRHFVETQPATTQPAATEPATEQN